MSPLRVAEAPVAICKNNGKKVSTAISDPMSRKPMAYTAAPVRSRNRRIGMIGSAARFSCVMNTAVAAMAIAPAVAICQEPHA